VRAVLDAGPSATALAALGLVPLPELEGRLAPWAGSGDAAIRAAVCAALPAAAPRGAGALIARGLRDADATVRATCADAAARRDPLARRCRRARAARARRLARGRDRRAGAHDRAARPLGADLAAPRAPRRGARGEHGTCTDRTGMVAGLLTVRQDVGV